MQILENFSLKSYNSFGIEALARYFVRFSSSEELAEALQKFIHFAQSAETSNNQHTTSNLVLGGGSNILFIKNFDSLILKNEISGVELVKEDNAHVFVKVGAGENWHQFVLYCLDHNWAGIENLSLIPGNIGATPMQNIGAYGVEIKEVFHELEAWHIKDMKMVKFGIRECEFGYRDSVFKRRYKNQFVILNVTYRLNKYPLFHTSYGAIEQELERMEVKNLSINAIAKAVINIRSSKLPDPAQVGNAGSFFKNPEVHIKEFEKLKHDFPGIVGYPQTNGKVKLAAAWLIEQCGWKGFRKGDAGCHGRQALVLVNYGNATGKEILELSELIQNSVKRKFNVELEREVNII